MHDLPTYYLLPLTGINFKIFGVYNHKSNLKSTKINIETLNLMCEVIDLEKVSKEAYNVKSYEASLGNTIIYQLPGSLPLTLKAFKEGKYSKIPESIKKYIIENCGLPKNHDVILALHKDYKLKLKLEEELKITLEENAELLSIPKEEWFLN